MVLLSSEKTAISNLKINLGLQNNSYKHTQLPAGFCALRRRVVEGDDPYEYPPHSIVGRWLAATV